MQDIRYELTGDLNLTMNSIDFGTTLYNTNGLKLNNRFGALYSKQVEDRLLYAGDSNYTYSDSNNSFDILKDNVYIGSISKYAFSRNVVEAIEFDVQGNTIYASFAGNKNTLYLTDENSNIIATISLAEEINSLSYVATSVSNIKITVYTTLDYYTYDVDIFNKTISDRIFGTAVIAGEEYTLPNSLDSTYVVNCYSLQRDIATEETTTTSISHYLVAYYDGLKQMDTVYCKTTTERTKPNGGFTIPTRFVFNNKPFYIDQYNYTETCIAYDCNIVEAQLDRIIYIDSSSIYYLDNQDKIQRLTIQQIEKPQTVGMLGDDYICFNTTSKNNTLDLSNGRLFSRSNDFNSRIWIDNSTVSDGSTYVEQYVASGYNEQWYIRKTYDNGCNYPASNTIYNDKEQLSFGYYPTYQGTAIVEDDYDNYINIYATTNQVGGITQYPSYYKSIRRGNIVENYSLQDMVWPTTATLTTPVLDTISSTVLNKGLTYNGLNSSTLQNDINNLISFNYNSADYLNSRSIFLLNGELYGYDDKFIYAINYSDGIVQSETPVFNMDGYSFLGVVNSSVLLYAKMDKSLYLFTGSMVVEKLKDASGIDYSTVGEYKQMLGGNALVFTTNYGTILYYDNQFTRIGDYTDELSSSSNIKIGDNIYALYDESGYKKDKLVLETEYILTTGSILKGNMNGVIVRLDNHTSNSKAGKISLTISTLTDVIKEGETQSIDITSASWDVRGQQLVKFTPRFTACNAIKLRIESDFDILDMTLETEESDSRAITKHRG
jgi:hypothetical protein